MEGAGISFSWDLVGGDGPVLNAKGVPGFSPGGQNHLAT